MIGYVCLDEKCVNNFVNFFAEDNAEDKFPTTGVKL